MVCYNWLSWKNVCDKIRGKDYEQKKQAVSGRRSDKMVQAGFGDGRSCGDRLVCVVWGKGSRLGETDWAGGLGSDSWEAAGGFDESGESISRNLD